MNILEDLYQGDIRPHEKRFDSDSDYAKFTKIVADDKEKLTDFLNGLPGTEEQRHMLSQMMNAQDELSRFSEYDRFVEGFRLGAGLMLETFIYPEQSVLRDIN